MTTAVDAKQFYDTAADGGTDWSYRNGVHADHPQGSLPILSEGPTPSGATRSTSLKLPPRCPERGF